MSLKYIFSFFLLIGYYLPQQITAQNFTYFNTSLGADSINQVAVATQPLENGYLVAGTFNSYNSYRAVYVKKISFDGEVLWTLILDEGFEIATMTTGASMISTDDGHVAIIYNKYKTILREDLDIVLVKITTDGLVLWRQTYGEVGDEGALHLMQTENGGYLITGFQEVLDDEVYYYIIKTQEGGFKLWDKRYKWNGYSYGFWTAKTLDGGYIVSGFAQTNENEFNFDIYVVRIDSEGNELWGRNYGGNDIDEAAKIFSRPNGNFVLSAGIQDDGIDKLYHAEIKENGDIVWQKEYQVERLQSVQSGLIFDEDGSFTGVAAIKNEYDYYQPLLMNFSSRGDTLWAKPITFDSYSNVYVADIEPIEGGYVLAGFKHSPIPQHGWLVTIDEEGNFCEELGCVEMVVDIEEIAVEEEVFVRVSPNPVRGQATIEYQIPKEGVLKVYDYQGQLMVNYQLLRVNGELTLEVGDWSSGVYLYQLEIGEERLESGKLIVE